MLRHTLAVAVLSLAFAPAPQSAPLTLTYSTYFGGPNAEHYRDVVTDSLGYIYVAGGADAGYPTTPGAYDTSHNGSIDVVVTKLDPTGQQVVWSTFVGGPSLDRAYAIEVDAQGYVYVGGRAGDQFPTTPGAVQTAFRGGPASGPYPSQDKFVLKLSPNGDQLVYCTYFGAFDDPSTPIRDIAIDASGNCYIGTSTSTGNYQANILAAFQNGFDSTHAGMRDGVVAKINPSGTQVLWATYLGGSGAEWGECSVRTDAAGNVHYLTVTNSTDIPVTSGAYDASPNGGFDFYVAKINANGTMGWATYLGGSGMEHVETHELAVDAQGNVIVASSSTSTDYPTTPGAYDTGHNGNGGSGTGGNSNYPGDVVVTKLSPVGALVASTFVGGRYGDAGEGVAVDSQGNVYVTGGIYSDNFPTTPGAYQTSLAGPAGTLSGFLVKLSPNLDQLLYSTYFGSSAGDVCRSLAVDGAGNAYSANSTISATYPLANPVQAALNGPGDATIFRFSPPATADTTPPTATITAPTPQAGYSASATPLALGGTASDNVGVTQVTWSNAATGGTGTAAGTSAWTASIPLAAGTNAITVTARDAAGNTGTDSIAAVYWPPGDSDGDGLPDSWETAFFPNLGQGPGDDPDGDGYSNLQELYGGTDPASAASVPADADSDLMADGFEASFGFDPANGDQDGDALIDGQNDWDGDGIQNRFDPSPGSPPGAGGGGSSSSGGGGCGATGLEALVLLAALRSRRRAAVRTGRRTRESA